MNEQIGRKVINVDFSFTKRWHSEKTLCKFAPQRTTPLIYADYAHLTTNEFGILWILILTEKYLWVITVKHK